MNRLSLQRIRRSIERTRKSALRPPPGPITPRPDAVRLPLPPDVAVVLKRTAIAIARNRSSELLASAGIVLLGGLFVLCLLDWLVQTPRPFRLSAFVVQVLAFGWLLWGGALRSRIRRPTDREAALRLQEKFPSLRSAPISAIELAHGHRSSIQGAPELVQRLGRETSALLRGIDPQTVVSRERLRQLLKALGGLVVLNAVWIAFLWPASLAWLERWAGLPVPPPTRTIVRDVTGDLTVKKGSDVELHAIADGIIPRSGRVTLKFDDKQSAQIPALQRGENGKPGEFVAKATSVQSSFDYTFHLNDGEGQTHHVRVVLPPSVVGFSIRETFPSYTGRKPLDHAPGNLSFLVGSSVQVKLSATQPLRSARLRIQGTSTDLPLTISATEQKEASITFEVPANLTGISFPLANTDGIASSDDTVFRASSIEDAPPSVALISPPADLQTITMDAKVDLVYTCTDDFGVKNIELLTAVTDAATEDPPAPEAFTAIPLPVPTLSPAVYQWKPCDNPSATPGRKIFFFIESTDNREPRGEGTARTELRSLTIVSPEEKRLETIRRIRETAGKIRELGEKQLEIRDDLQGKKSPPAP